MKSSPPPCNTLLSSPGFGLLTHFYRISWSSDWEPIPVPELPLFLSENYHRRRTHCSTKLHLLIEDATVIRAEASSFRENRDRGPRRPLTKQPGSVSSGAKLCPLCKQSGRSDSHFLSECTFLPERHRKYMPKATQIAANFECDKECDHASPADQ